MNGVEINTRAYVATRLLLRWDYLYAVTLKTKVFGEYNHARLEVSWITSTWGLLLRGYTGPAGFDLERDRHVSQKKTTTERRQALIASSINRQRRLGSNLCTYSCRDQLTKLKLGYRERETRKVHKLG